MILRDDQIERYSRHILLPEIGGLGQKKLLSSKVLVIGAGGLGSPLLLYLAAAGIGTIGLIDDDVVELSNLQRQILHNEKTIGKKKTMSAVKLLNSLNSDVKIHPYTERLTSKNAEKIIALYDIVADGSDNFLTRLLVNDICFKTRKTLVSAAVLRFGGQLATFKSHSGPCYRCLYPEVHDQDDIPNCGESGIIGSMAGIMGSLQATEVIKELLEIGSSLSGYLLLVDGLTSTFRKIILPQDPSCHYHIATP